MSWWTHSQHSPVLGSKVVAEQQAPPTNFTGVLPAALRSSMVCCFLSSEILLVLACSLQVSRDLFGTCHFTQERTEDGRRRRLVKKAVLGECWIGLEVEQHRVI